MRSLVPRSMVALSVVLVAACATEPPPAPTPAPAPLADVDARGAIGRVLDDWHDAAANADEGRYFGHFAESAVFLGTDGEERWDLPAFRAYAHPHFAAGKAWRFHATARHVTVAPDGQVAWFDERLETERLGPARGSGVLTREGGGWKIALYDLSIPIPNERFAEVKAVIDAFHK